MELLLQLGQSKNICHVDSYTPNEEIMLCEITPSPELLLGSLTCSEWPVKLSEIYQTYLHSLDDTIKNAKKGQTYKLSKGNC